MAFFDKLSETLTNASKDVSQKAKDLSGVAKLTMDIHTKEDQVQKLYAQIGKLYFDEHKDEEPAAYEQMPQIKETLTVIEDMKKELMELKGAKVCPRCGQEVKAADAYCKNCGAKMEDEEIIVDAVVKEAPAEETVSEETISKETTEEVFED
ncbi:MAG: zinc ribbon domain-containing protein [Eubacterium sp.]|nr:zinc ribbon domain-containing protein [Eubacterium sp.]